MLGFFRIPNQLIDRLAGKQLAGQGSSPHPMDCGALSHAGFRRQRSLFAVQDAFAAVYRMRFPCWKETPQAGNAQRLAGDSACQLCSNLHGARPWELQMKEGSECAVPKNNARWDDAGT